MSKAAIERKQDRQGQGEEDSTAKRKNQNKLRWKIRNEEENYNDSGTR